MKSSRLSFLLSLLFVISSIDVLMPLAIQAQFFEESLERARQAVALNPTSFFPHVFLAAALQRTGKLKDAANHGRLAVELGPDNPQNHWTLGDILQALGRWEEAAVHYGRACEPSGGQVYCAGQAFWLQRAGKESEARKAAAEAVALRDTSLGTYWLAKYNATAGDRAEALRFLRRSSERGLARGGIMGDFASLQGDPEFEAIAAAVLQRMLPAARQWATDLPDSPVAHHDLGDALHDLGKWEESVDAYANSCKLNETQHNCAHHAYALHRAGREAEAREVGRRASEMKDVITGTRRLACYYALAGDRAEALHLLQRSLELGWVGYDNPDLDSLHGDPEFEALVAEVKKRIGVE